MNLNKQTLADQALALKRTLEKRESRRNADKIARHSEKADDDWGADVHAQKRQGGDQLPWCQTCMGCTLTPEARGLNAMHQSWKHSTRWRTVVLCVFLQLFSLTSLDS